MRLEDMANVTVPGFNLLRAGRWKEGSVKLFLIVILLLFSFGGYSTIYYVSSSTGNDANPGTSESSAWRSLDKVNSFTPKPGDQVLFKRGDSWTGTLRVNGSGTSGSPIVYGAYGSGEKPKIYGSEKITGWTRHSGNIYKAKVTNDINQLFIDGKRVQNARYPKDGYLYIDKVNSSTSITCNDLNGSINYSGSKMHTRTVQWRLITSDIISSSSTTLTVRSSPSYGFSGGRAFFLNNHLAFLTQAGEWYYDAATLTVYLWTPSGDTPANYEVRGSVLNNCVYAVKRDYITLRDLALEQSKKNALHSNAVNYLVADNLTVDNPGSVGFYVTNSRNLKVSNNYIRGAMGDGIYINNESIDWVGEAVEIIDNEIRDVGVFDEIGIDGLGFCNGIFARIKNAVVKFNKIFNNGYNGIQFYGQNTRVENNFIDGYCKTLNDGGGIYTWVGESSDRPLPVNSRGSQILSNIILNGNDDGTGYLEVHNNQSGVRGIFTDLAAEGVLIEGNTIVRSSAQGIFYNQNINVISKNNILFDNPKGFRYTHNSIYGRGNEFSGNIVCNIASTADWYFSSPLNPQLASTNKNHGDLMMNDNVYIDRHRSSVFRRTDTYEFLDILNWQDILDLDKNSIFISANLNSGETEQIFFNISKESKIYLLNNAKARDIYGNPISESFTLNPFTSKIVIGSNLSSITETTSIVDNISPRITLFSIISSTTTLSVPINIFTATDNVAVTGYKLSENPNTPDPDDSGWSETVPSRYTFSSEGIKTLYAWAKDAAGNVSVSESAQVVINLNSGSGVLGNTEVYSGITTAANRRAIPVTSNESGIIESLSIYHNGGNGSMLLGVYSDYNGTPGTLLG
ncbi:MAG: right-handed parallel beta-helix repeat-containing protein, partial [Mariniphaga sp.]